MKKLILFSACALALFTGVTTLTSKPTGAPAPASGGPKESGTTCFQSGCHSGVPTQVTTFVTTNIPQTGYVPGTTYNITVSFSGTGSKGFQMSVQNPAGQQRGTFITGSGTQINNFGNGISYITHTAARSVSTATWTFQWQAPPIGSGDFSFYGAFATGTGKTNTQSFEVTEGTATAVSTLSSGNVTDLTVYPQPATADALNLRFNLLQASPVAVKIFDLKGQLIQTLPAGELSAGEHVLPVQHTLTKGLYLLKLEAGLASHTQKIAVE